MTSPVEVLDPAAYVAAMAAAAGVLEAHATAVDMLDVAGVGSNAAPASDSGRHLVGEFGPRPAQAAPTSIDATATVGSGSDLASALSGAVNAARSCTDFASVSAAMTRGAAQAAAGRPGMLLASFLEGFGEVLANSDRLDATRFALGLEAGAERLAPRDDGRHPGGFAAVANAAADAALDECDAGSDLGETILAAAGAGIEELERGPVLDAKLSERGVVDGSAAALLLVFDSLASAVTGEPLPEPPGDGAGFSASTSAAIRYGLGCELITDDAGVEAWADLEERLVALCDSCRMERLPTSGWLVNVSTHVPGSVVELLAGLGAIREVHIALLDVVSPPASRETLVGATG